ncbi:hypothetical protein V493_02382 [Pseudogymnoascus sp. VKM F-4281 (FW-2241)]|nr:hypothetical protein V493_02382 [Pseudogymnoascus sp. VKM F-4281 (FW-2241)]
MTFRSRSPRKSLRWHGTSPLTCPKRAIGEQEKFRNRRSAVGSENVATGKKKFPNLTQPHEHTAKTAGELVVAGLRPPTRLVPVAIYDDEAMEISFLNSSNSIANYHSPSSTMARIWFITGSSRGLGLAITQTALKNGDSVIATARKSEQLSDLVKEYGSDRVLPLSLDVSNNDQVIKAVKAGHEKFGRIDVVVNNAGYANTASLEDIDIQDFRNQVDTNLMGVVYVSKAVVPILRAQKSGHIFQVSSIGGRIGAPGLSAYQCAKWAVGGFSTVLSQEVAPFGVRVTVLEPGGIRTDWAGSSMDVPPVSEPYKKTVGALADFLRNHSGRETSIPSKIADIIVKLLDEKEPPVRLLVGPDAVEIAEKTAETIAESDKKWRGMSATSA